jgi:hypothetical protein
VTALSEGQTQLILPPLTNRHITLVYPDGKAAVNAEISLSIYLWDHNHCAFHEGLPLGTFHTDNTGTFEVLAPLAPLFLDGISYLEKSGTGPLGVAYSQNYGLKTGSEKDLILKQQWQLTDDDNLSEDVELMVLTVAGQPRKDVDVYGAWQTNTCGGGERIGRTDSKGVAQIRLDPTVIGLGLEIGGPYSAGDPAAENNSRDLTADELHELFSKHKVTIRW